MGRPEMNEGVTEIGPLTNGRVHAIEIGEVVRYILVTMIGMDRRAYGGGIVKRPRPASHGP
jgi:hypothetical protein